MTTEATAETPPGVAVIEELYAEDLVQDASLRLDRVRHFLERPDAYLRKVVVNLAHGRRRWAAVERRHLAPPPGLVIDPELDELWSRLRHPGNSR